MNAPIETLVSAKIDQQSSSSNLLKMGIRKMSQQDRSIKSSNLNKRASTAVTAAAAVNKSSLTMNETVLTGNIYEDVPGIKERAVTSHSHNRNIASHLRQSNLGYVGNSNSMMEKDEEHMQTTFSVRNGINIINNSFNQQI